MPTCCHLFEERVCSSQGFVNSRRCSPRTLDFIIDLMQLRDEAWPCRARDHGACECCCSSRIAYQCVISQSSDQYTLAVQHSMPCISGPSTLCPVNCVEIICVDLQIMSSGLLLPMAIASPSHCVRVSPLPSLDFAADGNPSNCTRNR